MDATPQQHVEVTAREVKRIVRSEIVLPFAAGLAGLLLLVLLTALLAAPERTPLIANFLICALVLVPLALCLFPLYIGAVVAAFALGRLTNRATTPLQKVEAISVKMMQGSERISRAAASRLIPFGVQAEKFDRFINIFERDKNRTRPPQE